MVRILLLFVVGLPAVLTLLFGESFFTEVKDESLWRTRPAPLDYLRRSGGAHAPEAQRELEIQQRALGLIARLRAGRYIARAYHSAWTADASQLLTIDGSVVQLWNSQTGAHLNTIEAPSRDGATNRERLANGFGLATFAGPNNRIAAITGREPYRLFLSGSPNPLPLPEGHYEKLTSRGSRIALVQSADTALLIDSGTGEIITLAHPEIMAIGLAPNGDAVTASTAAIKWWRGAQLLRTIPRVGFGHPESISADASTLFIPEDKIVGVWDTATGAKRFDLEHETTARGFCATDDAIFTGDDEGRVRVWSAADGQLIRAFFAHPVSIGALYCGPGQFVSVDNNRADARLWDATGRSHPAELPPATVYPYNALVRQAASVNLPGSVPGLVALLEAYREPMQITGMFGSLAWLWLLGVTIRRRFLQPKL